MTITRLFTGSMFRLVLLMLLVAEQQGGKDQR
jgi:hypothetical protein